MTSCVIRPPSVLLLASRLIEFLKNCVSEIPNFSAAPCQSFCSSVDSLTDVQTIAFFVKTLFRLVIFCVIRYIGRLSEA